MFCYANHPHLHHPRASRAPRASAPHSHSPPHSSEEHAQAIEVNDDDRTARYSQLKQRNQALASRPGSSLGPGVITTPPQPTPASAKDTSVNIASAFHQALNTMAPSEPANARSSSRSQVPRSTSVEYEEQAQNASQRRLAAPPRRVGGSKPPSRVSVRGSDIENENSGETAPANGRGKSPFAHISDLTSRAMSQATFLMRQRSQEPEDPRPPSRQATDATLVAQANGNSYGYSDEEEQFQEISKSANKPVSSVHKRGRMSMDNKAYQPTNSDFEDESEEDPEDERKGRRRRKKKEVGGGPLRTLPVTQYDKRKKRKSRGGKGGEEDGSYDEEQEEQEAMAGEVSARCLLMRCTRLNVNIAKASFYDAYAAADACPSRFSTSCRQKSFFQLNERNHGHRKHRPRPSGVNTRSR